ncbi:MAG: hypothetical protein V1790_08485 [Planctomycetota bacterium]
MTYQSGATGVSRQNDSTWIPHRDDAIGVQPYNDATAIARRTDPTEIPRRNSAPQTWERNDPSEIVRRLRGELERFHRRRAKRAGWSRRFVPTGLGPVDAALPHGGLPCGAITEILFDAPGVGAMSLALRIVSRCLGGGNELAFPVGGAVDHPSKELVNVESFEAQDKCRMSNGSTCRNRQSTLVLSLALSLEGLEGIDNRQWVPFNAAEKDHRSIVLIDALGDFYPPAAWQHGVDFDRLIVLRPGNERDAFWAVDQSLRCPAVAVVIAPLTRLDDLLSRRLQLAAESSGCMGLILRSVRQRTKSFAAVQMLLESVDHRAAEKPAAHPCRITLLSVREGMPTEPLLVDLHHETGTSTLSPLPVDRSAAKTG